MKNYILVNHITQHDLEKIIYKIQEMYGDTGFVEMVDVYKIKFEDVYVLEFPNNPDFERFKYFVNFIQYSGLIDHKIESIGYWDLTENNPQQLQGKTVMLYLAANDEEYDNVFAITDQNQAYKLDFGNHVHKLNTSEKVFLDPKLDELNIRHIISIVSEKEAKKYEVSPKELNKKGCLGIFLLPLMVARALFEI